jgi:hypothetical protein
MLTIVLVAFVIGLMWVADAVWSSRIRRSEPN